MFKIFLRHYRRLGLFSIGMAVLTIMISLRSGYEFSPAELLVSFGVKLLGFLLAAIVLYAVRPGQRGVLEIAGLAALPATIAVYYLPDIGLPFSLVGLALFLTFAVGIFAALHSEAAVRIGARTTWRSGYSAALPYPAKLIWKHATPAIGNPEDHCSQLVARHEPSLEDPDTVQVTFKPRRSGTACYDITFLERKEPHFCRMYFEGQEADGTLVDGVFSMHIELLDDGCNLVTVREDRSGLPLAALVERWFDDIFGWQHDKLLDLLNSRYSDQKHQAAQALG